MTNKKGQFKIQQMAFMFLAVVILFIMAGLFYLSLLTLDARKQATVLEQKQGLLTAEKLAQTAEFTCGEPYCVDADKALVLKDRVAVADYATFWEVTSIQIVKLYPTFGDVECTRTNYPNCGKMSIFDKNVDSEQKSFSYVSLCRRDVAKGFRDGCELGMIVVGTEVHS